MAQDVSGALRDTLGKAVREALSSMGDAPPADAKPGKLSGVKGMAAGVALAAVAPLALKGMRDTVSSKAGDAQGAMKGVADKLPSRNGDSDDGGDSDSDTDTDARSNGDGGGGKGGTAGVGKGRRMPVQQAVDVAVPIETAYNQFTQYEDWPQFMHRVTNVSQDDPTAVSFSTKIWTRKREFTADIETQRPDQRIKWKVSQGITHTGVVTFHELAPRLTRIEVNVDVDPGSLLEKAARGMRHIKRAIRADLHRYKAFIEMQENETGAWRGVIEDGEIVEEHPDDYDDERDYSDIEEIVSESDDEASEEESDEGGAKRSSTRKKAGSRS
jgi:polyketide cyclase/dehydrase/lipid transport protein